MSSTKNTGSSEYQIKALTKKIKTLAEHLKTYCKDNSARHGLLMSVAKRAKHLKYLKRTDTKTYFSIIGALGIRDKAY